MTGKDLFGVVVRTTGLYVVLWGCWCLIYGLAAGGDEASGYIPFGIVLALAGSALLSTADHIVALAYWRVNHPAPKSDDTP